MLRLARAASVLGPEVLPEPPCNEPHDVYGPAADDVRSGIARNYVEMFYNPKFRHGSNRGLSPVKFERRAEIMESQAATKAGAIQFP